MISLEIDTDRATIIRKTTLNRVKTGTEIERMHVTSSNSKSKNKEPPKFLSSSGKRGAKFISVYNFSAQ